MSKTNSRLKPESYKSVILTWHSAFLAGAIILAVVNSVQEVNYFVLAAESAVGVVSAYFTAKKLGYNYYVDKRNKIRSDVQKELSHAKEIIGISNEIEEQDIKLSLAEMGNLSHNMTDRQMIERYSGNYSVRNMERLERAIKKTDSLTDLQLRQKTVPHQAMTPSIPLIFLGVGGALVFLDYYLSKNIGFEIGGFSSLVAGSSIFGARSSTNEEIDRIRNLSRQTDEISREEGRNKVQGKAKEHSKNKVRTYPLEDILRTKDDLDLNNKKKDSEIDYHAKLHQIRDEKKIKPVAIVKPKSITPMMLVSEREDTKGRVIRSYALEEKEEEKKDGDEHKIRKKHHRPKSAPPRVTNNDISR